MEETLPLQDTGPTSGVLPLELAPLRRRFAAAHRLRPGVFWADLAVSAGIGWTAFAVAGLAPTGSARSLAALLIATLALYRAVLFIHEIAHLRRGSVPGFEVVWNLLVGLPLMVPSLMYVGSHREHHDITRYGTELDPEYEPIASWRPLRIAASFLVMPILPPLLALRWGVIGPISRLVPPLRPFVVGHLSTLVINARYRRAMPRRENARRWALEESAGAVYFWVAVAALASGAVAPHWAAHWLLVGTGILVLNHARTLAAHRYENEGEPMDWAGQLCDSINMPGVPVLTALVAPVGLRYHGLHHMMPGLPYHSLGAVHRALVAELPEDSAYRSTQRDGLLASLRGLFENAARRRAA
ncbi:MAG: fatty acid desaturase [Myxococcales bacterium]|nr:fatty acid desaturase [Myxococcales bacterium]